VIDETPSDVVGASCPAMVMFDAAAPAGRHVVLVFFQLVGVSTPQQLIGAGATR
jgi:hypothetical protein